VGSTLRRHPGLGGDTIVGELPTEIGRGASYHKSLEHPPHYGCLSLVDDKAPILHVVPQRRETSHPHPLALGCRDLVANALARDLALELREGKENVQHETPHGGRRVELLSDGDKGHLVPLEHLDQPSKVGEASGQAIDLVDDHDVDLIGHDVVHEALERRPLHVASGVAAVVITIAYRGPPFGPLAHDVGLPGLALRIERIEGLVQAFVGRHPRVDGATLPHHDGVHLAPF